MSEDHIVILDIMRGFYSAKGSLYYYQGNFFYPFFSLRGAEVGMVKRAIRKFSKANAELIKADRSHPDYRTLVQLAEAV